MRDEGYNYMLVSVTVFESLGMNPKITSSILTGIVAIALVLVVDA